MKALPPLVLASLGLAGPQMIATPADLLAHAPRFDGKMVTTAGTVKGIQRRVMRNGNAFTLFDLCEETRCVHVFEYGTPSIADGQTRTVTGTFFIEKRVGSAVYRDQIDVPR